MPSHTSFSPVERAPELYAQLTTRSQEPPPEFALPLTIAGNRCGWVTQAACEALRQHSDVELKAEELVIAATYEPGAQLNALLAELAVSLKAANCLRGWRDELLDITTATGNTIGAIERAASRPFGIRTFAVHLNAWTRTGEIWIARRALDKATDPGMWDTLVGGLACSGESLDQALVRESGEEAGLDADHIVTRSPLRHVLRLHRRLPEGYQVEDLLVSDCTLAEHITPANRDGEVSEIASVTIDRALQMVADGAFTLEAALVIAEAIVRRQRQLR
jgi:8-oxo-dGTP pyrophosphatase MutT (NUDIX family)